MSPDALNYLREVLPIIIERAMEAKQLSKATEPDPGKQQRLFEEGRALAYYEVVSFLLGQAPLFGLTKTILPELDFDPDKELL